ncbi:MAG: glycosyltransferase family 2 protein [Christiangramia sp.]|uniref:glycosyltransferase family 2 protein n=1 Tax=Christiangramia sp. TaxID=1931228 RepID=UPI003242F935
MKTALLVSTYNWPEALDLIFRSLLKQKELPDEVLIADDGSGEATKKLIADFKAGSTLAVKHVWQEDHGYHKSKILNKAIAASEADYIIQIDGDCLMHPHFIQDHKANAEATTFLFGSRVNIEKQLRDKIMDCKQVNFGFFQKGLQRRTRNIHFPILGKSYKCSMDLSRKLRGCNISFWREDFIQINGYNEDMTGWGREDSEMAARLLHCGVAGKRLRYQGIVYHLWHPINDRGRDVINSQIQQQTLEERAKSCSNGIGKYL